MLLPDTAICGQGGEKPGSEVIARDLNRLKVKPIDRRELEDKIEKVLKGRNRKTALNI